MFAGDETIATTGASTDPHEYLIEDAQTMINNGQYDLAVISCQTAAELFYEQILDLILTKLKIVSSEHLQTLKNARLFYSTFDIDNPNVQAGYTTLTGDKIQSNRFWVDYKSHKKVRNAIIHYGKRATKLEAESSLEAVSQLIAHINQVVHSLPVH